jgi:endoglucanase
VNVSNFYSTQDSIAYGKQLSSKVGNKHFVIDTSRNGNGPYTDGDQTRTGATRRAARWESPTTKTETPGRRVLVGQTPGESDGECKGGPKAGQWWPTYALKLAKATK